MTETILIRIHRTETKKGVLSWFVGRGSEKFSEASPRVPLCLFLNGPSKLQCCIRPCATLGHNRRAGWQIGKDHLLLSQGSTEFSSCTAIVTANRINLQGNKVPCKVLLVGQYRFISVLRTELSLVELITNYKSFVSLRKMFHLRILHRILELKLSCVIMFDTARFFAHGKEILLEIAKSSR